MRAAGAPANVRRTLYCCLVGDLFNTGNWPKPGSAHWHLLKFLDKVHRANGTKSQKAIAEQAHLSVSQVNKIVRGLGLPGDEGQVRSLIRGLGGGEDEEKAAVKLDLRAKKEPGGRLGKDSTAVAIVGKSANPVMWAHHAAFPIAYLKRDKGA
jgi:hypothetical protein